MNFKLRNLVAATLAGSFLMGFGANAMADSTTDIVDALVAKGVMTDEEATLIKKGRTGEKEAQVAAAKKSEFDFINSDAPFKYDFKMGGHDADIQVYGIIDVGAVTTNHSLPTNGSLPNQFYPYQNYNAAAGRQYGYNQGGLQDSRLGFKGGVDLFKVGENNVKFIFQLEGGFNPIDGSLNNAAKTLSQNPNKGQNSTWADSSLNGELFGRQAWGGVDAGQLGKLTGGLQYNPFYNIFGEYDPTNKADTFSPFGESGTVGGGGGVSEDARMKNSIKYANELHALDGKFTGSAIYQFGNASGDTSNGYGLGLQAGYENSMFGVQVAYDKFQDAIAAGTASASNLLGSISAAVYNTEATLVAFKFTPNKEWKVKAGWEWYERQTASDNLDYTSLWGYNSSTAAKWKDGTYRDYNVLFAGAEYNFGERFHDLDGLSLAVGYYDTILSAQTSGIGVKTLTGSNSSGRVGTWTAVVDYKINKRFDVYAAATQNHYTGSAVLGGGDIGTGATGQTNINAIGTGVRMKF